MCTLENWFQFGLDQVTAETDARCVIDFFRNCLVYVFKPIAETVCFALCYVAEVVSKKEKSQLDLNFWEILI